MANPPLGLCNIQAAYDDFFSLNSPELEHKKGLNSNQLLQVKISTPPLSAPFYSRRKETEKISGASDAKSKITSAQLYQIKADNNPLGAPFEFPEIKAKTPLVLKGKVGKGPAPSTDPGPDLNAFYNTKIKEVHLPSSNKELVKPTEAPLVIPPPQKPQSYKEACDYLKDLDDDQLIEYFKEGTYSKQELAIIGPRIEQKLKAEKEKVASKEKTIRELKQREEKLQNSTQKLQERLEFIKARIAKIPTTDLYNEVLNNFRIYQEFLEAKLKELKGKLVNEKEFLRQSDPVQRLKEQLELLEESDEEEDEKSWEELKSVLISFTDELEAELEQNEELTNKTIKIWLDNKKLENEAKIRKKHAAFIENLKAAEGGPKSSDNRKNFLKTQQKLELDGLNALMVFGYQKLAKEEEIKNWYLNIERDFLEDIELNPLKRKEKLKKLEADQLAELNSHNEKFKKKITKDTALQLMLKEMEEEKKLEEKFLADSESSSKEINRIKEANKAVEMDTLKMRGEKFQKLGIESKFFPVATPSPVQRVLAPTVIEKKTAQVTRGASPDPRAKSLPPTRAKSPFSQRPILPGKRSVPSVAVANRPATKSVQLSPFKKVPPKS